MLLHAWARMGGGGARPPERDVRVRGLGRARPVAHVRLRSLRREAALLGERRGRIVFASDIRALAQARPGSRRSRRGGARELSSRALMPPIRRELLAGVQRLPAAHLLRWRAGARSRALLAPRASTSRALRGCGRAAARAARGLDPSAPAKRRPGRDLAERRGRLVGGRRALGAAGRRSLPPRVHRALSGLRAGRVALRRRGGAGGRGRGASRRRADGRRPARGPRSAGLLPGGAGGRRASTRSGG